MRALRVRAVNMIDTVALARPLPAPTTQGEMRRAETKKRIMKRATPPPFVWEGVNYLRKVRPPLPRGGLRTPAS